MNWAHIHADWWQNSQGDQIHAVEVLDDNDQPIRLFYGYLSRALTHCREALSLGEAMRQLESMRAAA